VRNLIRLRKAIRANNPRMVSWECEEKDKDEPGTWVEVKAKWQLGLYAYFRPMSNAPQFWVEQGETFWCHRDELKDLEPTFVSRVRRKLKTTVKKKVRYRATRPSSRERKARASS